MNKHERLSQGARRRRLPVMLWTLPDGRPFAARPRLSVSRVARTSGRQVVDLDADGERRLDRQGPAGTDGDVLDVVVAVESQEP